MMVSYICSKPSITLPVTWIPSVNNRFYYIPRIRTNSIFHRATWLIFSHIWWSVSDGPQGILAQGLFQGQITPLSCILRTEWPRPWYADLHDEMIRDKSLSGFVVHHFLRSYSLIQTSHWAKQLLLRSNRGMWFNWNALVATAETTNKLSLRMKTASFTDLR